MAVDFAGVRTIDDLPLLDMHSEAFLNDPHAIFRPLQKSWPLVRSRRGIEVIGYEWNTELFMDRRFDTPTSEAFVAKGVPPMFRAFLENGFLLGFQGQRHDLIRRVLQKGFSIRRIDEQRDVMRDVANQLVDGFIDRGGIDFVADYSQQFPVITLCRLLGVPREDIPEFQAASIALHLMGAVPIAPGFPEIEASLTILHGYVARLVEQRRKRPEEDFISALIEAERSEGTLAGDELVWNIANLLFAGQDTTRFQLASIVRAMVTEPGDAWERVAMDRSLTSRAMQEGIRFHPAAQWNSRRALEHVEYRGFHFVKGQWVFLHNVAASRDPNAFQNPDSFDLDRTAVFATPFGRGLHNCLGQVLARGGMEESLKVLTQRLTDVELASPPHYAKATSMIGGPETLPLRFNKR